VPRAMSAALTSNWMVISDPMPGGMDPYITTVAVSWVPMVEPDDGFDSSTRNTLRNAHNRSQQPQHSATRTARRTRFPLCHHAPKW
jgi:hypothetical protein